VSNKIICQNQWGVESASNSEGMRGGSEFIASSDRTGGRSTAGCKGPRWEIEGGSSEGCGIHDDAAGMSAGAKSG
jgi:hypothetical protein